MPAAHATVEFIVPMGKYGQLVHEFASPWLPSPSPPPPSTEAINPVGPNNHDVSNAVDVDDAAVVVCVTAWGTVAAAVS
jgi:hypothetical protein